MGDAIGRPCAFGYGALTLCGPVFNPVPLTHGFLQLPAGPSEPAHAIPQHPTRNPRRVSHAQGLAIIRFRSPLLTEYPFLQVLRCFTSLRTPRPKPVPTHDGRWVPPFGNPRIKALLAAPRGISQPQTSFIGPVCQGIHHTPLQATRTTRCAWPQGSFLANSQTTNHHTKMITKRSKQTLKNRVRFEINSKTKIQKKPCFARVHYPVLKPPRTATPSRRHTAGPQARRASNRARQKPGVAIREPKSASAPLPRNIPRRTNRKPMISSTPATRPHATIAREGPHRTPNGILYSP